ncbi:hypothetical protein [Niallia sp. 03133]
MSIGPLIEKKVEEEQKKNEAISQNELEQNWSEYTEEVVKDADVEIVN